MVLRPYLASPGDTGRAFALLDTAVIGAGVVASALAALATIPVVLGLGRHLRSTGEA